MNVRRFALCLAVPLVASGCSGSDEDEGLGSGDYSVVGALAEIPEAAVGDEPLVVETGDLRAATEAADLSVPDAGDEDEVMAWLSTLTGYVSPTEDPAPVFVPMAAQFNVESTTPADYEEVAGWSVLDVDTFVESGPPPDQMLVVGGDLSRDALDDDLIDLGDGVVTDRDAEDHEMDPEQTLLNQTGAPSRFAQEGDLIAMSTSTELVRDWLDGSEALADDESLRAVAEALDEQEVISALVTEPTPDDAAESFDALAIGWAVDDGDAQVYVAYHFESAGAAENAAEQLQSAYRDGTGVNGVPYSEMVGVEDVSTDGSVATVSLRPADGRSPRVVYDMWTQREPVFAPR